MAEFTNREIKDLNSFSGFFRFQPTWVFKKFVNCDYKTILLTTGNQFGKTGSVAFSYVLRILGMHPIAKRNILYFECEGGHAFSPVKCPKDFMCTCGKELKKHKRSSRVFRFCSENLPGQSSNVSVDGESAEVKNTQYPEFKKWLPPVLIKKDITFRIPSMIISDPYGGSDIIVEFVSYNQRTQAMAGVQRVSIWCDEAPSPDFYEEQLPRLLAEDGDIIFTYTPADRASWLFDEFFDRAKVYYRSEVIAKYLSKRNFTVPQIETTDSPFSIAVIQAATDDNPTLNPKVIDDIFRQIDDPDVLAIRRYGIFKQLSGRIFKDFEFLVHIVDGNKYFPDGVPRDWTHARGIDFHPQTPWAIGMISLSPQNEAFIWGEFNPSPEQLTIREISRETALLGKDYKFRLNKIDPFSKATQIDNITALDDINRAFRDLRKEGIGLGGYWDTWDTKGERGRDVIRERLKNSKITGRPFNNEVRKDGRSHFLPTIWVLGHCKISAKSFRNWRWQEWADSKSAMTKEDKNAPEQKWSHFPMVYEAIFKEPAFKPPSRSRLVHRPVGYFRRG